MRIFIASDDPGTSYQLREQLLGLGQECPASQVVPLERAVTFLQSVPHPSAGTVGSSEAAESNRDLVFVILSPAAERSLDVVRDIRRRVQPGHLFLIGPTDDSKLVLRAMREGANEYLDAAELAQELPAAIERLRLEDLQRRGAKLIALIAPSGGAGCSTLAVNLATLLARQPGGCVLLDLETAFGDLASLLDLKPLHTSADLCRSATRIDRSLLEKSLVRHENGLAMLAAPLRIGDAAYVTGDGIQQVLSVANDLASYVVADLSHSFLDLTASVLTQADRILIVLRLDFTALRNTRRVLEHLEQVGIPQERIAVVANRYGRSGELTASEAQSALGVPIAHYIVEDPKNVNRANNQGVPVVEYAPSAKVSRQLADVASRLSAP